MHRVAIALLVSHCIARAHGPAPAALSAVGPVVAEAPAVVRTNIGLAVSRDGAWRYGCPALWGAEESFPPVVRGAGPLAVAHDGVLYRGDGCAFEGVVMAGWSGTQIAHVPGWVVERRGDDTVLWETGEGATVAEVFEGMRYDSARLDGDGALWLAGARPAPMLWRAGAGAWRPELGGAEPQFLDLRGVGEAVVMSAAVADGTVLLESGDGGQRFEETLRAGVSVHGPVGYGGGRIALADGVLFSDPGDGFEAGPERGWTCLQALGDTAFACADRGLARITGPLEAPEAVAVFAMDDLVGLADGCPPDDALRVECERQWLHFGAEAGLVRFDAGPTDADAGLPADVGAGTGDAAGGCDCDSTKTPAGLGWLLLFALRRRA